MQATRRILATALVLIGAAWTLDASRLGAADADPADPALARTRKVVQMLDDLYKNAIVLITTHYVDEKSDLPAGEAFKALFATMREKGWHEMRLLDATGDPIVDDNLPQDDFERDAIRAIKSGKPYYERVVTRDGQPYLRRHRDSRRDDQMHAVPRELQASPKGRSHRSPRLHAQDRVARRTASAPAACRAASAKGP